jgi:hypothetical protein
MEGYDQNLKLGLFGDSFLSSLVNPFIKGNKESCFDNLVGKMSDANTVESEFLNTAKPGTGPYWAYKTFNDTVTKSKHKIEHAVVSFTDARRLPFTTEYHCGSAWVNSLAYEHPDLTKPGISDDLKHRNYWQLLQENLGMINEHNRMDEGQWLGGYNQSDVFAMWNLFFENQYESAETIEFLNTHCLSSTIALANKHDINLVIVIPFNFSLNDYITVKPDVTDTHMVITGLGVVSKTEIENLDPFEWLGADYDARANHLCKTNNQVFADLIYQGFQGQKGLYDLRDQAGLDFTEITNYIKFTTQQD